MPIKKEKTITSILWASFFCLIIACICLGSKNQSAKKVVVNSYFFQQGTTLKTYKGRFYPLSGNLIEQDAQLNIKHLKDFNDGSLYSLRLSQLEVEDPFDAISSGHEHLGYFFVQRNKIYRIPFPYENEVTDYEEYVRSVNMSVVDSINAERNTVTETGQLVYSETGSEITEGEWHSYIDIEDNKRIYRLFSDYIGGTRHYELMAWEKGKGLVYYIQGSGSYLMHIEFGEVLSNEYYEQLTVLP